MRLTVSLAIVLALAVGGLVAYEYQRVPIKSHVVVACSDPKHVGNSIVRNETLPTTVRRKDYSGPLEQHSWNEICKTCRARAEAEATAKHEREEREAKEREEAEQVFGNLEVKFGMTSWAEGPGPRAVQEVTFPPGHDIMPAVSVKNLGQEPISGLRFALKDDDKCLTYRMPEMISFGLDEEDRLAREASNKRKEKLILGALKDLFGRGVPISAGPLNPYGKYSNDIGGFNGDVPLEEPWVFMTKFGPMSTERSINLSTILTLRSDLPGGQDKHFSGYLIYKGVRRQIGTITIHVMYPG